MLGVYIGQQALQRLRRLQLLWRDVQELDDVTVGLARDAPKLPVSATQDGLSTIMRF